MNSGIRKTPLKVCIRDDDVCFFTDVDRFRTVHRLMLERDLPLNVAVIPKVSDSITDSRGNREGFIPESWERREVCHPITENIELVRVLKETISIEIAQHGLSHERRPDGKPECEESDRACFSNRLKEGKRLLTEAFGYPPLFLVPPYDSVSAVALSVIRSQFEGISLAQYPHELLPVYLWPRFLLCKYMHRAILRWGRFSIVWHPGIDVSLAGSDSIGLDTVEAAVRSIRDVLVLTVHSWAFFRPDGRLNDVLLSEWERIIRVLSLRDDVRFVHFSSVGGVI